MSIINHHHRRILKKIPCVQANLSKKLIAAVFHQQNVTIIKILRSQRYERALKHY